MKSGEMIRELVKSIQSSADSQARSDSLKGPGTFFWLPKTSVSIESYREAELYSIDQLIDYVNLLKKKYNSFPILAVQKNMMV